MHNLKTPLLKVWVQSIYWFIDTNCFVAVWPSETPFMRRPCDKPEMSKNKKTDNHPQKK